MRNCGPRGEERRHDPRVPQLAAARAVQTKPFRSFDCILRDISEGGCRLVGVAIDSIHSPFLLTLPGWPAPRHCEVAWRARKSIGVRFGEWATPADEAAGGRAVTAP
ncbi:PilZ domain-containing protein [Siculibacillus lacustris]|uniref:PilZ domain-containing protein n=1 Tax=Siculibacillus lacustris TaxID=1549641 RepID=A0A4Q9VTL6_9HYPH|nr:PilZ domain-containing protein [Siculibacillus lacustris]TBW39056.1 PilZ domain-containing protein [Siculibacillus lacustris]